MRIVHQDVQPAELTGPPPRPQPPIQPPTPHRDGRRAVCVDFPGYLGPGLVLDIGDQDGGTFAREPSRSSAPTPLADPVTRATRPASLSTAPFPQFRASSYSHQQLSVPLPDAPDEED